MKEVDIQKEEDNDKRQRFIWNARMERALIYTLLDQVRDGKRADTGYKNKAWIACIAAVRAEYNRPEPEKKHL